MEVLRVEFDCENGNNVGMFLAEFHTDNVKVKQLCNLYRNTAPLMPEPEYKCGVPYCISFGCKTLESLMDWFGWNMDLLSKVLTLFKLRVYSVEDYDEHEDQVGFVLDEAVLVTELIYQDVLDLL